MYKLDFDLLIKEINSNFWGRLKMNEYTNLTSENIDDEHICCAIGDKKHQEGVDSKKSGLKAN